MVWEQIGLAPAFKVMQEHKVATACKDEITVLVSKAAILHTRKI